MADDNIAVLREDLARSLAAGRWGEAAAVAVFLGFEPVAGHPRFARYVGPAGVSWPAALKDPTWSEGERFLIATAAGLWTGRPCGADVCRVPFLDDGFYEAWLAMVTAARTGKVRGDG
ncbi:MAG TPA: hypothetical protein VFQ68_39290 [Streptosporangiaceae bacterium]|nr:hypothetical protein [Streptosporangiaceae bacterium]